MENKSFIFTNELTKRMLRLRFDNDRLFKSKKRPWREFYNLLLQNGFPTEMTLGQVRKKWSYTWEMYKIAKKERNRQWRYYKMFDKHFGKTQALDKYESWSIIWRLKLITCILEERENNLDHLTMWRAVEGAMRYQDLPEDCCIQDLQGLWHHIKLTFLRKFRMKLKRAGQASDWAPFDLMLEYYDRYEPDKLVHMRSEKVSFTNNATPKLRMNTGNRKPVTNDNENEFQWSKDVTESFIQIRLQNEWLFNQRIQAWKDFVVILRQEHGFPNTLTSRDACRKWSCTYGEYQKATATGNKSWIYYNLFELYLGESSLSMNPLLDWEEVWVLNLIEARTSLEDFFVDYANLDPSKSWREVEKRLKREGIPLNHSLLDLPNIWSYLNRTYKWKRKFADKGVLKEHWPYFEAMTKYMEVQEKSMKSQVRTQTKKEKDTIDYDDSVIDDYEDDIKLFELKQKREVDLKPEHKLGRNQCRACADVDACVDIFEHKDQDDLDVASKLKIVGGIEVEKSESFPSQICHKCLKELDNAYKFRRKCQTVDKQFRDSSKIIKIEFLDRVDQDQITINNDDDATNVDTDDIETSENISIDLNAKKSSFNIKRKVMKKEIVKKKNRRRKYEYWKVCEICGVHTKNLASHVDAHNDEKPYSCHVCGKKFKFKNGLFIHKSVHDPTPRKTCEICGKTFHVMAHYRRHYVHHANERKFACETCGKRFNSADILRIHTRVHTDERPFNCPECGKTFRTSGCVSRHKRIVHRITKKV